LTVSFPQSKGAVSPNARIAQIDFGWEICPMVGQETFRVNSCSISGS
jgi:hypothetical protein